VDARWLAGGRDPALKRSSERILTTHVGSLPVPDGLTEVGLASTVTDIVKKQAEIGVDVVNDGELSKGNWMAYEAARLGGFVKAAARECADPWRREPLDQPDRAP
jgi:5-methyltetrahydropteroyltriglutamate--homocysteine methyltransferase